MFTIDLLKGQGIPAKSRPESIAVTALTAVIPLVIAIVMISLYLTNSVVIDVKKQELAAIEKKIADLAEDLDTYTKSQRQKSAVEKRIMETAQAIGSYQQWSDILVTIVENMPDPLVLEQMSVSTRTEKIKVPDEKNPGKQVEKVVPVRTMHLTLGGEAKDVSDHLVTQFRELLQRSHTLGPKLQDIPVSQHVETRDEQEVVTYEMKCIFKPQI